MLSMGFLPSRLGTKSRLLSDFWKRVRQPRKPTQASSRPPRHLGFHTDPRAKSPFLILTAKTLATSMRQQASSVAPLSYGVPVAATLQCLSATTGKEGRSGQLRGYQLTCLVAASPWLRLVRAPRGYMNLSRVAYRTLADCRSYSFPPTLDRPMKTVSRRAGAIIGYLRDCCGSSPLR